MAAARDDHYDSLQGQVDQYFNEQVERAKEARQEVSDVSLAQELPVNQTNEEGSGVLYGMDGGSTPASPSTDGELFQTIGARGATINALRSGNFQALRGYLKAKALDGRLTAKEIKKLTGWEKGPDNKWRYEIDDPQWDIPKDFPIGKLVTPIPLDSIVKGEDLFIAYPQLAKIKVQFEAMPLSQKGYYNPNTETIGISSAALKDNKATIDALRTIVHELQHRIQNEEGFTAGGHIKMMPKASVYARGITKALYKKMKSTPEWMELNELLALHRQAGLLAHTSTVGRPLCPPTACTSLQTPMAKQEVKPTRR